MAFHISGWFWRSSVLLRWNYEEVPVGWHSKLGHRVRWTLHARGLHRPVQVCQVDKWRYAWHRGDVSLNADVKARGDVADAKSDARGVKRAEKHWLPLALTRGQFEAWWWPHDSASCRALSRGDRFKQKFAVVSNLNKVVTFFLLTAGLKWKVLQKSLTLLFSSLFMRRKTVSQL